MKTYGFLLILLCVPLVAYSQPAMTQQQYQTLKIDITVTNQTEFAGAVASNNYGAITGAYNALVTPVYYIYKYRVSRLDILFGTSSEGTTFKFTTNGFITRTIQEIEAFRELFSRGDDATNPGLKTVQDALLAIFSGTGDAQANRQHIGHVSRKETTRAERLYVTGGTGTKADPGLTSWQGTLTQADVEHALTLP